MIQQSRRGFLLGLGAALVAAPAIVRAGSLMPVKSIDNFVHFLTVYGRDQWGNMITECIPISKDGWARSKEIWEGYPSMWRSDGASLAGVSWRWSKRLPDGWNGYTEFISPVHTLNDELVIPPGALV